jgi:hypothetical protein
MIARALSLASRVSSAGWIIGLIILAGAFGAAGMLTPRIGPLTFDPFNRQAVRLRDAKAAEARANSDAAARGLEVQGEREQAQRIETFHRQEITIRDVTSRADTEARSDPDANEPLPTDLLDRLRRTDRRLCDVKPATCPPSPPLDPGGGV